MNTSNSSNNNHRRLQTNSSFHIGRESDRQQDSGSINQRLTMTSKNKFTQPFLANQSESSGVGTMRRTAEEHIYLKLKPTKTIRKRTTLTDLNRATTRVGYPSTYFKFDNGKQLP